MLNVFKITVCPTKAGVKAKIERVQIADLKELDHGNRALRVSRKPSDLVQ
jgi:hypothetical protein